MSPNQPPPLSSFLHIFPTMRNSTQDNESLNIIHIRTEVQVRGTKHAHMLIFNQFATPIEQKQAVKAYDGLMNSKVGRFGQLCVLKFNEIEKNHRKIRKKNKGRMNFGFERRSSKVTTTINPICNLGIILFIELDTG